MLTNYDNIVFDLGGVVVNLWRERCIEAFKRLGFADADGLLGLYVQNGLFLDLEEGRITPAGFYDGLRALCTANPGVTDKELEEAFNAFITDLPEHRLDALLELRKHKRVFALSNTNAVMYTSVLDRLFKQKPGLTARDYFDGLILSYEEGVCKPKPGIFVALLRRYGLNPARTLFLDDSETNCEAARTIGIDALRIEPGTEFTDALGITTDRICDSVRKH